jgi:hypothetical protein
MTPPEKTNHRLPGRAANVFGITHAVTLLAVIHR